MALTQETYDRIYILRDRGRTANEVASATGCSVSQVYNVWAGRIKRPNERRKDAGTARLGGMEDLIEQVKIEYISQSKRRGNLVACIDSAKQRMIRLGLATPALGASKSAIYRHVAKAYQSEKWDTLFDYKKNKQAFQTKLPRLNYDYWQLVGFNDYWVIDGRKSDQWVVHPMTGKPVQPQGFYVMELKTRSFLHVSWSLDSFDAAQVATILLSLALQFGPPNLGVLCDNGMEQVGRDNVLAFESFWPDEIIQAYRVCGIPDFNAFFPGAISPVVTSLPRIPTEFAKAALERSFATVQRRFDAMIARDAYQGGGRQDVVHRTLTRVPKPHVVFNSFERFSARMDWFFRSTEPSEDGLIPYHAVEMPHALSSMMKTTGLIPTPQNAVEVAMLDHTPRILPPENYYKVAYYSLPRYKAKRITAIGQVTFRHAGETLSYNCQQLDYRLVGERVDIVPDPQDATVAGVFMAGAPTFIGVGIDVARRINTGRITVGQGREVMTKFRRERIAEVRVAADSIKEKPHEVPETLHGVQPLKAVEFIPQQPLMEVGVDDFSPEALELLRSH